METTLYSLDEVSKNDGKGGNRVWIIIKDAVYDVTDFIDEHPGGGDLIQEWAGKDGTKDFDDAGHSGDAKKDLKKYKIGELREEDRKQKQAKTGAKTENPELQNRSFCSVISCGLFG
ncbi:cytochrome b5-like [Zophobas morio]|uniref:cytochrome b5-like n=1 Tax=Zophobas morio TaxID=2755281 RepID=UPI0030832564